MSIKRVSDLELVGIDGIIEEESVKSPFILSRMEVSEAENEAGSKFKSKGYTIEALCKAFGNNIMRIPNIWYQPQTYLSSVIIRHPGYLSSSGNTYLHGTKNASISADFQNVDFHLNDRICDQKNVSISSASLYIGAAGDASLSSGGDLDVFTSNGNIDMRSPRSIRMTAEDEISFTVGETSLKISHDGIHVVGNVDFDLTAGQTFKVTNKDENIENILSCNSDGGIETNTEQENPLICYAKHALWS